jgi:hypothetical protein
MGALTDKVKLWGKPQSRTPRRFEDAPDTPEAVLARALVLFGPDGECWVQHKRRDHGRFCAIAAIEEAANGDPFLRRQAEQQLRAIVGRSPMLWNDSPGKLFSEIRAGFTAAITGDRAGLARLAGV